ncbi:MAG: hypothetical protein QOJ02_228 [Acidobacteriota bacterium]|jgi:hypothetical protein|nr:hypothetical protein [Acidobacteriota bacterium]
MGKRRTVISLCAAILLAGAFAVGRNTSSKAVRQGLLPHAHPSQQSPVAPDYVVYKAKAIISAFQSQFPGESA